MDINPWWKTTKINPTKKGGDTLAPPPIQLQALQLIRSLSDSHPLLANKLNDSLR